MKRLFILVVALLALTPSAIFAYYDNPQDYQDVYVVSAADGNDYQALKQQALALSKAIDIPYTDLSRIYDPEKGIIYPPDYKDDEMYAGEYLPRRDVDFEETRVSIEYKNVYDDALPAESKEMIIVTGLYSKKEYAEAMLKKIKSAAPDAEISMAKHFYMGCMH